MTEAPTLLGGPIVCVCVCVFALDVVLPRFFSLPGKSLPGSLRSVSGACLLLLVRLPRFLVSPSPPRVCVVRRSFAGRCVCLLYTQ